MWDHYPEHVLLIHRSFKVVAGNLSYMRDGGQIGSPCYQSDSPGAHKGCKAIAAMDSRQTQSNQNNRAGLDYTSYWVPVEGTKDYQLHFSNGYNDVLKKLKEEALAAVGQKEE